MTTKCLAFAVLFLVGLQAHAQSAAEVAARELRKCGVRFKDVSSYGLFLENPKTREEALRLGKGNTHIVIDDSVKVGRENLKYLRDLTNLKEIVVGPDFPDDWFKELETLTQLEGLFIQGLWAEERGLTDRGMASVAKLTNLQALSLLDTRVTDDGLRHIKGLTKLRWLNLGAARNVTNKGLVHLKDLKNLDDLNLEWTKTGREGAITHCPIITRLF